uniref:Cysteine-rich protein n=1 Tax=Hyaloperonospora arabidopsidis TaxID=272952 RepID=F6MEX7_HYAAB|nr:cysteine-rich protein [Hyaloperonospora arabidopsidis]
MHVKTSAVLLLATVASGPATFSSAWDTPGVPPQYTLPKYCGAAVPCDGWDQSASSICTYNKDANVEFKDCCLKNCVRATIRPGDKCSDVGVHCDQLNEVASQTCGEQYYQVGDFARCCTLKCQSQWQH